MKQFIYLDIDIINSIIAQKDKGLVLEMASEHEKSTGSESQSTDALNVDGTISGGLWKLANAEAKIAYSGEVALNSSSQTVSKEIATKTLHDAAFDIAYAQIKTEYDLKENSTVLGDYIESTQAFEFVDLSYIESILTKEGLIDLIKKTESENIAKEFNVKVEEEFNRTQRRKSEGDVRKEIKKLTDANSKKYDDIAQIIRAIRQVVPYSRMLVSKDGYLIPFEDKYFRDNPETIGFKHSGQVTCVGYITNIISANIDSTNIFSQLQSMINNSLIGFFPTRNGNLYIVHPIAIYYGK